MTTDADQLRRLRQDCFAATKKELQQALTPDLLIVQADNAVHDLHKMINTAAKRLREWCGGWLPELDADVDDHRKLAELIAERDHDDILKALGRNESIGTPLGKEDLAALKGVARHVLALIAERDALMEYIEQRMQEVMPNTLALCGAAIGADLLRTAGSLESLAKMPSGTIQLLGAETALFRHLRSKKHRPPKHGTIFNHQLLQSAPHDKRGKVARALADKIAIAIKVDRFKGEPCGEQLREELERRFA